MWAHGDVLARGLNLMLSVVFKSIDQASPDVSNSSAFLSERSLNTWASRQEMCRVLLFEFKWRRRLQCSWDLS